MGFYYAEFPATNPGLIMAHGLGRLSRRSAYYRISRAIVPMAHDAGIDVVQSWRRGEFVRHRYFGVLFGAFSPRSAKASRYFFSGMGTIYLPWKGASAHGRGWATSTRFCCSVSCLLLGSMPPPTRRVQHGSCLVSELPDVHWRVLAIRLWA